MIEPVSPHSFYVPVMGTGFTIDTPLALAKYGISSVISLVDDVLIEQIRKLWCKKTNETYEAITSQDKDYRANRITAYLNLVKTIVEKQTKQLKNAPFEPNSDITRYFEMLPDGELKKVYYQMVEEKDSATKLQLQEQLRQKIVAGSIDVNIMTKLECQHTSNGEILPYEFCDAASALRGYANSNLCSSVVFSAGFNPHLYQYIAKFSDFLPDANFVLKKKICLKVSDYRSAVVQGKYLAKHGLWVSEYRIESPLNCGGHAFVNDGQLLGPILEEFKQRKQELIETLHVFYKNALNSIKNFCSDVPLPIKITAQGGIGTHEEHKFLITNYDLDAAGWGSPFLLVPEATNVDDEQLDKLLKATQEDILISSSSPLGVPFWNLRNSSSEEARLQRIENGVPGSICCKGYAQFNREFTQNPICTASQEYQKHKLQELNAGNLPKEQYDFLKENILSKSCICHDLAGGATIKNAIDKKAKAAICPGPNILNFKKIMKLDELINHIYGRCSLLASQERQHMFISEIKLHIQHLLKEIKTASFGLPARSSKKIAEVKTNLSEGIAYYQQLSKKMLLEQQEVFCSMLQTLQHEIDKGSSPYY